MPLLPPQRGGRKTISERLGESGVNKCLGVYVVDDISCIPVGGLADLVNGRAEGSVVSSRGGQSKRNTVAMDAEVYGILDTDGLFDV
jgi:hypothetical protein